MAIEEMCDSITSSVFQYLLGQSNSEGFAFPLQGSEREYLAYKSALQTAFTDFAVDYADLANPLYNSYLKWQKAAAPILGRYFQPKSFPRANELVTIWMEFLPSPYQKQFSKVTQGTSYFLMRMENQLQNQPEFSSFFNNPSPKHRIIVPNEPSQISRASVEVLFLLPNEASLAQLKEKVPHEQRDTIVAVKKPREVSQEPRSPDSPFGSALKKYANGMGISLASLAQASKLHPATLSKIVHGKRVTRLNILAIVTALIQFGAINSLSELDNLLGLAPAITLEERHMILTEIKEVLEVQGVLKLDRLK